MLSNAHMKCVMRTRLNRARYEIAMGLEELLSTDGFDSRYPSNNIEFSKSLSALEFLTSIVSPSSAIQNEVRNITDEVVPEWRKLIDSAKKDYQDEQDS